MLALKIKVNKCLTFIFLSLLSINNYLTAQDKDIFLTFQSNLMKGIGGMKNNNYGFNIYFNYQKTKIRFNSSNFEIKLNIFSNLNT